MNSSGMNEAESEISPEMRRLIHAIQHASNEQLRKSSNDIWSVVRQSDRAPPGGEWSNSKPLIIPPDAGLSTARIQTNQALEKEIREINEKSLDAVVKVIPGGSNLGTLVECSFNTVAVNPKIFVAPLCVVVPANYPQGSLDVDFRSKKGDDYFSVEGKTRLKLLVSTLPKPLSLKEIAQSWGVCVREVFTEYAIKNGGGTFSSRYGTWETL
ncbi:Mediator of RNA polymerase II transcription subunit 15a [Linum grandiflorum]